MKKFNESLDKYEDRLREAFGDLLDEDGLKKKHKKMRRSAFLFLRATCWRWAECAVKLCPDLTDAPVVPSVGDAHAGNFGLWRDAHARLVWGVNDYDEAALLPYPFDLVRLCASLLLSDKEASASDIANQILTGYRLGLDAPRPFVLERDRLWLRDAFYADDDEREEFWQEFVEADDVTIPLGPFEKPLRDALPTDCQVRISARSAGAGSLGRPRFAGYAKYRGGPLAAEIKGRLPSCWAADGDADLPQRMANGVYRSPDPSFVYAKGHVLRRLAPNNRKVAFDTIEASLKGRLIRAMASDLAAVHLGGEVKRRKIEDDLDERPSRWLSEASRQVAEWTQDEFERYRS